VLRVYLLGEMCIERDGQVLRAADFPSRQVRHAFAYLAFERHRAAGRDELTRAVWPNGEAPRSRDVSLSAVISRLRALLARFGLGAPSVIAPSTGCYQLRLPSTTWVDVEEARRSLHEAEGSLVLGNAARAYQPAVIASSILRRPLLIGARGAWVEHRRTELRSWRLRALEATIRCLEWNGELALALQDAETIVALAPLRESGYRHLMRLHRRAGNRAEALAAYHRCRDLLADEVGVAPSSETEALYLQLLSEA
jgi:DNA-binding SARP family transcriptional activator